MIQKTMIPAELVRDYLAGAIPLGVVSPVALATIVGALAEVLVMLALV